MKVLLTRKKVMEANRIIVKVGYCRLQFLLTHKSPYAYTVSCDSWGSDVYNVNNIAISTGYSSFGNITPPYAFLESFDNKAEIILGKRLSAEESKKAIDTLLKEFSDAIETMKL